MVSCSMTRRKRLLKLVEKRVKVERGRGEEEGENDRKSNQRVEDDHQSAILDG